MNTHRKDQPATKAKPAKAAAHRLFSASEAINRLGLRTEGHRTTARSITARREGECA
jgi:hypothetical protein